jgi:hypothetical protein
MEDANQDHSEKDYTVEFLMESSPGPKQDSFPQPICHAILLCRADSTLLIRRAYCPASYSARVSCRIWPKKLTRDTNPQIIIITISSLLDYPVKILVSYCEDIFRNFLYL